jgi:hypothetical protein
MPRWEFTLFRTVLLPAATIETLVPVSIPNTIVDMRAPTSHMCIPILILVPAAGAVSRNALVATFPLVATFQRTLVPPMLIPVCILETRAVLPDIGPVVPAAVVPLAQSS